jgi:hypothetical protein
MYTWQSDEISVCVFDEFVGGFGGEIEIGTGDVGVAGIDLGRD